MHHYLKLLLYLHIPANAHDQKENSDLKKL